MATTKNNGSVQSVSSNGAAVVHYEGPPVEDITYTDLSAAQIAQMNAGLGAGIKVDVTADHSTNPATGCTGVVTHK